MIDQSHKRHIAKAITWRIVGTIDTMLLAWLISGNPLIGLKIGLSELLTKMFLYYLHERAWFKINLSKDGILRESRKRHIAKTVTWRMVGTLDTMLVAWFISGNPFIGLKVGLAEISTKMILYYLHERVWYRSKFGLQTKEETMVETISIKNEQ
nr:DUF2061 domain-containing protein [uncultured Flavobacterium sp.]